MEFPKELKYTKDHEWVRLEGKRAVVGITAFAQSELGDIVFIEVPPVGKKISIHSNMSVVESVKAVSDIYAPLTGTVVEINEQLADQPELVNQDPYGEGWIAVLEWENNDEIAQLIDVEQYQALALGGK
ncbi:MAG TPA: glycine cleavage system protein GcvH [Sporomusaceae bacterium]|jgi:glycine cleavage system H protein|uniref:glycine cleavage system protein GcvH n=1 Tax=Anaerospora sp. TaxID=1960278 RepID=UPI000EC020AD|nr:glycine cleavage system protein GcvH [Anaerospora sp.]HAK75096.1 glycine cleavage system protein GcvH [Sporomusaceae bacterium]